MSLFQRYCHQSLWSWAKFFVNVSKSLMVDVCIYLSSGDIDVAEHLLNTAQIVVATATLYTIRNHYCPVNFFKNCYKLRIFNLLREK